MENTNSNNIEKAGDDQESRQFKRFAHDLITSLGSLLKLAALYDPGNKIFMQPGEVLIGTLRELAGTKNNIRIEQVGEEFFINKKLIKPSLNNFSFYQFIIDTLQQRGIGGLELTGNATLIDAIRWAVILSRFYPQDRNHGFSEFNELLTRHKVQGMTAIKPLQRAGEEYSLEDMIRLRRQRALTAYQNAIDYIKDAVANIDLKEDQEEGGLPDVSRARRIVQRLVDLSGETSRGFAFVGLAAIRNHDEYTYTHMVNVCVLSIAFGRRLGLSRADLGDLGMSAIFHDYGKVEVPLSVLNKNSKFTDEEWRMMQDHAAYGIELLSDETAFSLSGYRRVLTAVEHHLNCNASGYPALHLRPKPHIFARMVAIADAYDAMTTNRVYQRAMTPDKAMQNLVRTSGTRYDPILVRAFISAFGIFPIGSLVLLNNGVRAVVTAISQDQLLRPEVKIARDASGNELSGEIVDLSHPQLKNFEILRCLDPEVEGVNVAHYLL